MNKGTVPAVMLGVLMDATPVEVAGKVMHTHYPSDEDGVLSDAKDVLRCAK